jgi:hypothetical protein
MASGLEFTNGSNTKYGNGANMAVSYMQSMTPTLQLGGHGKYSVDKGSVSTAVAGCYDDEKQLVCAVWDHNVSCY